MDIYSILITKHHNLHYIKRYYNFIMSIKENDMNENDIFEAHHICPKANDLFPEYSSFRKNPWNKILLTPRQHFIAHWILSKAYGGSQVYAFWSMTTKQSRKISKREYRVSSYVYEQSKRMQNNQFSKDLTGIKKPKNSKRKKGMVHCYDSYGNFNIVSQTEFRSRNDLRGISNGNSEWCKSDEGRKTISNNMSNREWIYNPNTMNHKLVKNEDLDFWLSNGFQKGFKNSYDRKSKSKECPHCKKQVDPANFSKWHGDKCKFNNVSQK